MSKLITGILNEATGEDSPKSRRLMKRIRRGRKLYFRDVNGSIRRLDKVSVNIYDSIIVNFLMGDAEKRYQKLNKDKKTWQELKPIHLGILKQFRTDFAKVVKLAGKKMPTIFYNGSWKPLAQITLEK